MPPPLSRRDLIRGAAALSLLPLSPGLAARSQSMRGAPFLDPSLPVAERVKDLLGRMTPEEKVAQLVAVWGEKTELLEGRGFSPERASASFPQGFSQLTRPADTRGVDEDLLEGEGPAALFRDTEETVRFTNALLAWSRDGTRLGIPVLSHEEALHGYMASGTTHFPQAIALAGSFDRELVQRVNAVSAREVRARGIHLVLSPVVDIVRDPRWGRIEETFGEDPYLVGEMGVAAVEGLQGPKDADGLPPDKVYATLKHMTGHGQPESGTNVGPAPLGERELRAYFFPPFREVVERTGIRSVMPSYNEIDGIPSHASPWLLGAVLRDEWGFDGIIVSDYNGIQDLVTLHHLAPDLEHAARLALEAGVDVELPDGAGYDTLLQQLRDGQVDEGALDRAVERVLEMKFRAGLFEAEPVDPASAQAATNTAEARALALEAARRSLCLLKNDEGLLPLDESAPPRLAVIGPNADVARLGGYSGVPADTVSLVEGLRTLLGPDADLRTARGVNITTGADWWTDEVELADPGDNHRLIEEAVAVAADCDVIVLAIGDTAATSREGWSAGHLGDRTSLDLVGEQNALFLALEALGKPVVVCAINGRPPSWPTVVKQADALLECWYAGQAGGTAIAEALFGRTNPGAKLPVSVARSAGHVPSHYNHKPSGRRGYLFDEASPLFPFGFGMSYTRFEVGEPNLPETRVRSGSTVVVEVAVENTGDRPGDEVVQIYLKDPLASVTRPVLALKEFRRVTLEPGERRTLRFELPPRAFALWNRDMEEVIEPGRFEILAGNASNQLKGTFLELI